MSLDKLTKIDGGGISTTSDYRVGVITATKFVGPVEGSITATDASFSGNVSIAGTLTYEDVTNVDSVGILTARTNIILGDSIKHLGDENTLISFPANDTITAHTSGSERLRISSTGRVAIGTDNTTSATGLTVYRNDTSGGNMVNIEQDGTGDAVLGFAIKGTAAWQFGIDNSDSDKFKISHDGSGLDSSTAVTLDRTGKVGIGTNNPNVPIEVLNDAPGLRLTDKNSSAGLLSYTQLTNINGNTYVYTRANSNNGSYLIGGHGGGTFDEYVRITNTGKVGIGTNNQTERLTVHGTATDTTPILGLRSGNNQTTTNNGAQIAFGHSGINHYQHFIHTRHNASNSNNAIDFYVCDGTQQNTVTSGSVHTLSMVSGKVGIGTNNPSSLLSLFSDAAGEELIHFDMGSTADRRGWKFKQGETGTQTELVLQADANGKSFNVKAANGDECFFVHTASSNAYVRITPELYISDTITHIGDSNTKIRFPAADTFSVETAGAERLRIASNGQVTISPGGFLTIDTNPAATYGVAEALRIDDGAGTGDRALQIFEYSHSGARSHRIQFNLNTTTNGSAYTYTQGNYGGSSQIEFHNTGHLLFFTNAQVSGGSQDNITPSERLRIASDGKVGINQGSPTQQLDVSGSIKLSAQIMQSMPADYWSQANTFIELNGVGNLTHMGSYQTCLTSNGYRDTNSQWVSYGINSTTGASQIRLDPTGYILFATEATKSTGSAHNVTEKMRLTSTGQLNLAGNIQLTAANPEIELNNGGPRFKVPAANTLTIHTGGGLGSSGSERVRITSTGRVGINSTAPSSYLDVQGDGTLAIFGSTDSSYEALMIKNNVSGYPAITNESSPDTLEFRSAGSVQATIDYNNNDTNKYFRVMANAQSGDGTELFKVEETGLTSISGFNGTGLSVRGSGSDYQGMNLQVTDASASQTRNIFIDVVNENGYAIANQVGSIQSDGGSAWIWQTQPAGNRTDRRVEGLRIASDGRVGINESTPSAKLEVTARGDTDQGIYITDSNNTYSSPYLRVLGKRDDGNNHQSFSGRILLASLRTDAKVNQNRKVGVIMFGGNHTNTSESNILYPASIAAVAGDSYDSATDMPTDLVFYTGSTGRAPNTNNVSSGEERLRIQSGGNVEMAQDVRLVSMPNSTWGAGLKIGGNGQATDSTYGSMVVTNGNLHLDARDGSYGVYLNWYGGGNGTYFGNGAGSQRGRIDGAGNLSLSGSYPGSDLRLKENIQNISGATDTIKSLVGKTFTWKTEAGLDDWRHYGFIAQEVQTVAPDLVKPIGCHYFDKDDKLVSDIDPTESDEDRKNKGITQSLTVNNEGVTPILVEAMKELIAKVETLEAEVAALKSS